MRDPVYGFPRTLLPGTWVNRGKEKGRSSYAPARSIRSTRLLPYYCCTTTRTPENSEVLPPGPVAVAVILLPAGTRTPSTRVKETSPFASVLTLFRPRYPVPALPKVLEKKRMVKFVL